MTLHLKSWLSGLRKVDFSYQAIEKLNSEINITAPFSVFCFLGASGLPSGTVPWYYHEPQVAFGDRKVIDSKQTIIVVDSIWKFAQVTVVYPKQEIICCILDSPTYP